MAEFTNRADAGRRLGAALGSLRETDPIVLGLPRGGVPVAAEVAAALDAPLDVLVVRKLGLPFQPEVAMGAIGEGGVQVVNEGLIARAGVTGIRLEEVEARERATLEARVAQLRPDGARLDLSDRTAIIVDDGIATGATSTAACAVARRLGARRVIVAAPVGGPDAVQLVQGADDVVCLLQPAGFQAVGAYYDDFTPTRDADVVALLVADHRRREADHG